VQSALAAGLCLGLPAGLIFWLITMQRWIPSVPIDRLENFVSSYFVPPLILEMVGAFGWGLLLGKISGYRRWWWLSIATMAGVRLGGFALYRGWLPEWVLGHTSSTNLSMHVRFGLILGINALLVTINTGLLLGLTLGNWKASLMLAANTGLVSVLAAMFMLILFSELGIRVGSGNAAMPKVTAAATMAAALAGGAVLGVTFSRYAGAGSLKH
jgi:hypothetical protein